MDRELKKRPLPTSVTAIVLGLLGAAGLAAPLLLGGGAPAWVIYAGVASGAAGLAAAYGLWSVRRWGTILAVVVAMLGILSAAPGMLAQAIAGVAGCALVLVLVLLPASRRAYA